MSSVEKILLRAEGDLDAILTLPSEVFKTNTTKATKRLSMTLMMIISGIMVVRAAPWFLLPFGWLLLGTAQTGLYAVGYSCGKNSFFGRKEVNYVIGTLCMLPLMYPFRFFQSPKSEKTTNNNNTTTTSSIKHPLGDRVASTELWFLSSLTQWIMSVQEGERNRHAIVSASLLYSFAVVFFGILHNGLGLWGIFKYYLIPLGVFHFWMSAFMKAKNMSSSPDVYAQFPFWVDMMSNDYNYGMTLEKAQQNPIPPYTSRFAFSVLREQQNMQQMPLKSLLLPKAVARAIQMDGNKYTITIRQDSRVMKVIASIYQAIKWTWGILCAFNWLAGPFLILTPIASVYGLVVFDWYWQTFALTIAGTAVACMGVTLGYHRLWSHKAYEATHLYSITVLLMATSAFEMSCLQWANDHRAHHRYTDTDKDPYNIQKGFWYAHIGWLMWWRKRPSSDLSDLEAIWYIRVQHYLFVPGAFILGWGVPCWIAGHFWGDYMGGLFIAGIFKSVLAHHFTFAINSVAHMWGEATYSDQRTPRDNIWTALITFGEGYHNFHHEFPYDYRNGIKALDYDPTKWVIYLCSLVGLTYNLQRFSDETIAKGRLLMESRRIEAEKAKYNWGVPVEKLPQMTIEEATNKEKKYMIIEDVVHDMSSFASTHPGGEHLIKLYEGKDGTKAFNGGVYNHSVAARNILATLRVGRLVASSSSSSH